MKAEVDLAKRQRLLKLCFELERALPRAMFAELFRHENLIRGLQRLPPMSEEFFAAEVLKRWEAHS